MTIPLVLFVDDRPEEASVVEEALSDLRIEFMHVRDPEDAVVHVESAFHDEPPADVVLVFVRLRATGAARRVLKQLKQGRFGRDVLVGLCSTDVDCHHGRGAACADADECIQVRGNRRFAERLHDVTKRVLFDSDYPTVPIEPAPDPKD